MPDPSPVCDTSHCCSATKGQMPRKRCENLQWVHMYLHEDLDSEIFSFISFVKMCES